MLTDIEKVILSYLLDERIYSINIMKAGETDKINDRLFWQQIKELENIKEKLK